jgi:hypothetical protein
VEIAKWVHAGSLIQLALVGFEVNVAAVFSRNNTDEWYSEGTRRRHSLGQRQRIEVVPSNAPLNTLN